MTGADSKKVYLTLAQVQNLLSQGILKKEPVKMFLTDKEFVTLPLISVGPDQFILGTNISLKTRINANHSYQIQFGIDSSILNFIAVVINSDNFITLRFEKNAELLNRRESFRYTPPEGGNYYVILNIIDMKTVNDKYGIIDLSVNGLKLLFPAEFDASTLATVKSVRGKLHLEGKVIEFKGDLKNITKKNLSVQFNNLGESLKNEIWNELMKWYRTRKK
jgi:hypothetical protein